jgi:hypothetical protein
MQNDDTRKHYISLGIISRREPVFATYQGSRLNAAQLDAKGFRFAAEAKRGRNVSNLYMAGKI